MTVLECLTGYFRQFCKYNENLPKSLPEENLQELSERLLSEGKRVQPKDIQLCWMSYRDSKIASDYRKAHGKASRAATE